MRRVYRGLSGILLATLGAFATSAVAQEATPSPFPSRLAQAIAPLDVNPDGLSGAGALVLSEAVAASRYVLIGETHHTREIPALTTQICRLMAPSGLTAMAIETGPEAARVVDSAMRSEDREARIADFVRTHPDGIAFFNGRDEVRMAGDCAATAGPKFKLWGLDQEFLGSSGPLLQEMLASRPGPLARAALTGLAAQDREATAAALASGSPFDLFLLSAKQDDLDQAAAAVARDGGARVRYLFGLLTETRAIYQASQSGQGDANGRRARLMKRTFAAHLAENPGARVLLKFGANHAYKSLNPLNQRDLGAYVAERAEGEGVSALHIIVLGARGSVAVYGGVGRPAVVRSFDRVDDKGSDWRKDATLAKAADAAPGSWMLVDLRMLRTKSLLASAPAEWRDLALGYDIAILAPTFTASSVLGVEKPATR
ncbi:TraB/GumN family protein [Caulobacter hibisci]|uniref:Haem-binding uptake Tiki superfamily ChaN domain-containing protein n=1 Tax=Caulobacter hibisci TaxID=2035993 RepID=A0ABS0SZ68_9CAUL|nr:hypothetical protein [Caulobacter hibisci]MBI1683902.1 hypothetical protein [Caulobacter hibisci]